jgi:hypothetical protein
MMINQIEICRREMTIIPLVMISMISNFTVVVYRGPYGNAINLPAPTHMYRGGLSSRNQNLLDTEGLHRQESGVCLTNDTGSTSAYPCLSWRIIIASYLSTKSHEHRLSWLRIVKYMAGYPIGKNTSRTGGLHRWLGMSRMHRSHWKPPKGKRGSTIIGLHMEGIPQSCWMDQDPSFLPGDEIQS